jgi:peptide/nickel transport system permease protein
VREAAWISAFPGVAIAVTVLGLNLVGDGLRDVLDPRMRVEWTAGRLRGRGC